MTAEMAHRKGAEMAEQEKPETGTDDKGTDDIERMKAALEKANKEAAKFRHQLSEKESELEKLKADSDSSRSEMDKVKDQLAKLNERAEKAERQALVATVAQSKGLTPAQAGRLRGQTKDELESDADQFLADIQAPPKQAPTVTPEPSGSADTTDYAAVADDILR